MAKNQVYNDGNQFSAVCSQPAVPVSGDPVLVGKLPGVALTTEDAVTGETTVKTNGVYNLAVLGHDGTAAAAIAVGDIVYYDTAATPKVNVKTTAVRFGYALAAVSSGATATIPVKIGY
jgi:predicted RecA/RadA family phage recombinase